MSNANVLRSIINDLSAYNLNLDDYGLTLRELLASDLEILKTNLDILSGFNPDIVKIGLELYQHDPEEFDLLADKECTKNLEYNLELVHGFDHDILGIVIEAHNSGKISLNENCNYYTDVAMFIDNLNNIKETYGDSSVVAALELVKKDKLNLWYERDEICLIRKSNAYNAVLEITENEDNRLVMCMAQYMGDEKRDDFAVSHLLQMGYTLTDNGWLYLE